ncbi:MAG: phosphoadenylyl-sulfate reductase [bacterium]
MTLAANHLPSRSQGTMRIIDATARIAAELALAERPCVTTSFQAGGVVLIHMLRNVWPDIPVLFIDTVHHFPETYAYRDRLVKQWRLNLVNVRASAPEPGLWQTSTDACCARHKVDPLFGALEPHDVWFTALRRDQSPSRSQLADVAPARLSSGKVVRKANPIAGWSTHDVETYASIRGIPLLPLYEQGYTSIGCEPCTQRPTDPSNPRSGRWQGEKLECGIHIEAIGGTTMPTRIATRTQPRK